MKVAEIRQAHKANIEKAQEDNEAFQARYYARTVSYYLAWLLIKLRFTPNMVSTLAFVVGMAGCAFITVGNYWLILVGVLFMNIRHLLDYADGTLARAMHKTSQFGSYLDRLYDELIGVLLPVSIGIGLYNHTSHIVYLILGLVYALITALSALSLAQVGLVYHITPHTFYQPSRKGLWRLVYVTGTNLQSTSTIILLPLAILDKLEWYLFFYLFLTSCEVIAAITVRMVNREDN